MSEEITEISLLNVKRSIASIVSSFNIRVIHWGNSNNSNTYYITNYILNDRSLKFENLLEIEDEVLFIDSPNNEDQKAFNTELFPNDQKVIKLICKHLTSEEKNSCMLVCKRFYKIIFSTYEILDFGENETDEFPKITCHYKEAFFTNPRYTSFKLFEKIRMKYLGKSLTDLIILKFSTNLKELCELLRELPLLESLFLEIYFKMENNVELSLEDIPKLLKLKHIKLSVLDGQMNDALAIFDSAPIVQSLSLFNVDLNIDKFNYFLKKHKHYLRCLTLSGCSFYSDLKYSKSYLTQNDFKIFDQLHQLRELHLDYFCRSTLRILKTNCMNWLTDFVVVYKYEDIQIMNSFYVNYLKMKDINEVQLSEYDASKGPIIINSKCPTSQKCRTTFFHLHNCAFENNSDNYDHNECVELPLSHKELNWIDVFGEHLSFYVQVRDNVKDFRHKKKIIDIFEIGRE